MQSQTALRQLFYQSRATDRIDIGEIVASSKRNNGIDGISGLLLFDGKIFLQVLEGPEDSVAATFQRICSDSRHEDVTVLRDHLIEDREFPYWSMESREPDAISDDATWRLRRRLEQFAPEFHHYFFGTDPE